MHATHRPGTDNQCPDCRALAYEPSWYAALVAFVNDQSPAIVHREPVPAS
jgi:hypothetical protein